MNIIKQMSAIIAGVVGVAGFMCSIHSKALKFFSVALIALMIILYNCYKSRGALLFVSGSETAG
jgi:hypothetical protein